MRVFIVSAVIFVLLLGVVVGYQLVSSATEKKVLGLAENLENQITTQDTSSKDTFSLLYHKWKSTRNLLMSVSEHADLDKVEEHLENIGSGLKYNNFEDAYREVKVFKMLLKNIFLNSKPTLTNIL